MKVTAVVCCYNGADQLPKVLQALAAQTIARQVDVLVVDDGSTDATAEVAKAAGVRVVSHERNAGLAAARNTGWRAADSPVVAFTDDDCRPRPDWLERLVLAFEDDPAVAVAGGSVQPISSDGFVLRYLADNNPLLPLEQELLAGGDGLLRRLWLYVRRSVSPVTRSGVRDVSSVVGASMAFRTDVLKAAGGFDERFRFGGEEEDLCRRLVLDGARLRFLPDAVVHHQFEPGLADTLRRARAYGRGNARMYLKHEGLSPTVYPLPLLVMAAGVAAVLSPRLRPWALAAAVLAPQALFARWPVQAITTRRAEVLAYPYLQLLQESASDLGLAQGLRDERAVFGPEQAR